MTKQTHIIRQSFATMSGNLLATLQCFDLTNADESIIIYPYGDIYEIFAIRKGDKYEIEFDRDTFSVSLEQAKRMAEIWYNTENIIDIRNYISSTK